MVMFFKAASIVGSLLLVIALVIALLKALIGFVGFLAFAIKLIIVRLPDAFFRFRFYGLSSVAAKAKSGLD